MSSGDLLSPIRAKDEHASRPRTRLRVPLTTLLSLSFSIFWLNVR